MANPCTFQSSHMTRLVAEYARKCKMELAIIAISILLSLVNLYQLNCLLMVLSNSWYFRRRLALLQVMHASSVGPMRSRKFVRVVQLRRQQILDKPWTYASVAEQFLEWNSSRYGMEG